MPHASANTSDRLSKKGRNEDKNQQEQQKYKENNNNKSPHDVFYGTEELLDALPKLWTKALLYVLIACAGFGLPWAIFSKVDETGSARGRLEPKGATQKLDSPYGGSVKAVKIKEGGTVRAGQVLLEIESDILQTDLQQAETKLKGLEKRQSELELLKNQQSSSIGVLAQQNQSLESEKMAQVNQAQQNLDAKVSTYKLQKLEKQTLVSQAEQQLESARNQKKAAEARLTIDSRQVERYSKLVEDGVVSANQIDQLKKEEQESQRLYEKADSDIKQAELGLSQEQNRYQTTISLLLSDIEQAKLRLKEAQSSFQTTKQAGKLAVLKNQEQLKDLQTQISTVKTEIEQTKSQIKSIKLQLHKRVVRSPIDGVIFALPVTKPGAVVQPGQRIAEISPKKAGFVLKASIPSQDSGFLKVGMPVKIKFDAYPFQEYGIVSGKVNWISPDSKVSQTLTGNTENYDLIITLDQQYVQSGNKRIPLTAGQTANAEVIIRQRRIIDFVLDPFKRLEKGGLNM